jgi:hypothetical protein
VGDSGTVLRWNGTSWAAQQQAPSANYRGVFGFAPNDVWLVGSGALITHWNGTSWSNAATISTDAGVFATTTFQSAAGVAQWVRAVGMSGTVLRGR